MDFWQRNRQRKSSIFNLQSSIFIGGLLLLFVSCTRNNTPKPYGYYRIAVPDTSYIKFENYQFSIFNFQLSTYPYSFALSRNAVVQPRAEEPYWVDLFYPALDATVHCSYKPVRNNLRELTNDALEFVYRNASFATSIPESDYTHPEAKVYGVLFDLEGNTASSCQFFVTDSTRHFFRASVYCNCPPNADSLAPVYEYLRKDIIRMVESFEWK
jgi:gliding motility-associated lipoprotein GldD